MKIAFYKSTRPGIQGIYSRIVRWIDRGEYSHCEIIFSDGMSGSASFIDKGVRLKKINYDDSHWDFIELPDHLETAARAWFEENKGKGYDLLGNLRFVFFMVRESDKDWFCNEACAAALGMDGGWRLGPNGFYVVCKLLSEYCNKVRE